MRLQFANEQQEFSKSAACKSHVVPFLPCQRKPCRQLARSALTGSLPEGIFKAHLGLEILGLDMNDLTGTLPADWAASQVGSSFQWCKRPVHLATPSAKRASLPEAPITLPPHLQSVEGLSVRGNRLSGPLLPAAWLAPGAMPHLKYLTLDDNAALTGPLPASLPWPALTGISLAGTQVESSAIPASWCSAPNVAVFSIM